jgi:hypothetical protein
MISNTIVIESQKWQGQSNIVFSSSISVADAIRAASKLKADLKFSEVEAPSFIVWQRIVVTFNMKTIVINQPWKEGHKRRQNEL